MAFNFVTAEELYRLALEASPSGLLVSDEQGKIVLVNHEVERLFGYRRDELIGQPVEVLLPERFRANHPGLQAGYLASPSVREMGHGRDLAGRRKDGSEFPVEVGLNPVTTPSGTLVMASLVDISARRALELRLRHAEKMEAIGVMAGGIAHDFNNLLLAIMGYSEMLRDELREQPQAVHDLDRVLQAAERGSQLVQRILAFSRRDEVGHAVAKLDVIVKDALPLVRAAVPGAIELREHLDPATPAVRCDATQMNQILMNLAVNAAHAMGDRGGVLDVSVVPFLADDAFVAAHPDARPGLHARVSVADTGSGMSPDVLARIFEPFFTTKPVGKGTGLGLSVLHGIVRGHGGVIDVRSHPGEGTTFDVYLPAAEGEALPASPAPAAADARPHILFVEDEPALLELGRRQLEALGYRVTASASSLEALERFRMHPDTYDLLITDNNMPRMTGLALATEVLKMRPAMKVMMVSGLAEGLEPATLHALGIRWVVRKPHTRQALAEAVKAAIEAP